MVTFFDFLQEHYRTICGILLITWATYYAYTHPYSLGDSTTYVVLIGAEILLLSVIHYRRTFFLAVMISFLWAGLSLPLKGLWGAARWPVLLCAAIVGMVLWLKEERTHFGAMHLFAMFCVVAAMASAAVSAFPRTAFLKSLSLLLLFLYTSGGVRVAILDREREFTRTLLVVCEVVGYVTALLYLGLGFEIFGNSNSLGAVAGVVLVPLAGCGVLLAESNPQRRRSLLSLAVSVTLLLVSRSRAGLLSAFAVGAFLLLGTKQYRLFFRGTLGVVAAVALIGIWSPEVISEFMEGVNANVIYKGHREKGLLGSRLEPWNATMATIREHPFFGGGFGTTQTGAESEYQASAVATSRGTTREHGNSYLALLEWVGLLGIMPFLLLLGGVALEIKAVYFFMRRSLDRSHPAIALAAVCLAGLVGSVFEDWLFAVGYYLSVFVWSMAFCLVDLTRKPIQPAAR